MKRRLVKVDGRKVTVAHGRKTCTVLCQTAGIATEFGWLLERAIDDESAKLRIEARGEWIGRIGGIKSALLRAQTRANEYKQLAEDLDHYHTAMREGDNNDTD